MLQKHFYHLVGKLGFESLEEEQDELKNPPINLKALGTNLKRSTNKIA
jgi:hypothetical protein